MVNTPSAEACSALIEYWAKEYERLFGQSSSGNVLTEEQQIPPEEMKKYIENYKKWYEMPVSQEETKAKLSILKRISEAWQLNVDTINMLIKYMESTLAVFTIVLICGCQSGLYKVSTSEDNKQIDEHVRYYAVEDDSFGDGAGSFIKENGSSSDGVLYDEDRMPIQIVEGQSEKKPDKPGWSGVLWMFSLGIFPMCQSEYMTQEITVKSPVGEKTGSYRVDAKRWAGWIPIFIGYPASADERDADARLPNKRLEGIGKNRLVKNLVGEFSYKDYVSFAKKENANRKSELARIAESQARINEFLAKNQCDEAVKFWGDASKERVGSQDCDKAMWNRTLQLILDKNEDCRVSNKKAVIEKLFAESKFEDVVAECEKENGGEARHASLWTKLKAKAETAISDRDRKIELARIEKHKVEVEVLLGKKDYKAVIAECEKETGCNAGSRPEDADIWSSLRQQAKQAQDKIDRDQELVRIEKKVAQIEKWFVEKNYDSIVRACGEECGTNPGAQAEDMVRWKSYRSKALGLRLLEKTANGDKSTLNIKGFFLGMSMDEAEILLGYHFPSISHTRERNQIKIAGHAMVFCQAENDRIVKFSFNRDMLDKLFDYDVQGHREWATAFANEYGMDFRGTSVRDRTSRGNASISVSQDCYVNRDRKRGVIVSIFGEQDVSDDNKDPEELAREVEAVAMEMSVSGLDDNPFAISRAKSLAYRRGLLAEYVKAVREWLKEEYVNGRGAEDWTLRIETLK